jgi:hypothetical protein
MVDEARRTLGTRLAPDGNDVEQFKYTLNIAKSWSENIRTNKLSRAMAWGAFQSTTWPKIRYSLPATSLSNKQCEEIDKTLRKGLLPAIGINRNFPKKLVHGACDSGGLGIPSTYVAQGVAGISQLCSNLGATESMMAKLTTACWEALQVEIGSDTGIFELDFAKYGGLGTKSKLMDTWKFCHENGITIGTTGARLPGRWRGDNFITEDCAKMVKMSQLKEINKVRLRVKAVTWADIATMDGKRFNK